MGIYILIIRHIFEGCITGPAKKSKYTARYLYGFEDENAIALLVYHLTIARNG